MHGFGKNKVSVNWLDCKDCYYCKRVSTQRYKCLKTGKISKIFTGCIKCPADAIRLKNERDR